MAEAPLPPNTPPRLSCAPWQQMVLAAVDVDLAAAGPFRRCCLLPSHHRHACTAHCPWRQQPTGLAHTVTHVHNWDRISFLTLLLLRQHSDHACEEALGIL